MSMFGNMRNAGYVGAVQSAAAAENKARSAQEEVARLREQADKLTLVCAAMWELLRDKTGLTEEDLAERVAIVDARDGVADGKMSHTVRPCAKCGRPVAARHRKCLYCGTEQPMTGVFDGL